MATIMCQTCGAIWRSTDAPFSSEFLSTTSLSGRVVGIAEVFASGENLLTCPKDPREPLDSAIQRSGDGPKSSARKTGFPVDSPLADENV